MTRIMDTVDYMKFVTDNSRGDATARAKSTGLGPGKGQRRYESKVDPKAVAAFDARVRALRNSNPKPPGRS